MATATNFYTTATHNLTTYRIHAFDEYAYLHYAIFTRNGGTSIAPYESLNLSTSVGDNPATVDDNIRLIYRVMNILPEDTVSCHLVHGADIITVTHQNKSGSMGNADGLMTSEPGIFLFMRFADCTPLIFLDPIIRVVAITHAGWRGTMQNAAGETIKAMTAEFGSEPRNIIAAIGPSIGPCCYEVGPEVIDAAHQMFPPSVPLFRPNGRANHAHFDMWQANHLQLTNAGVEQVVHSNLCTACHTEQFFSHRAEKGRTGRFGVIIGIRGALS
jgi:YfiH family protein